MYPTELYNRVLNVLTTDARVLVRKAELELTLEYPLIYTGQVWYECCYEEGIQPAAFTNDLIAGLEGITESGSGPFELKLTRFFNGKEKEHIHIRRLREGDLIRREFPK
ncbi:hypothetical protein HOA91_02615 [Candidatus Woesearchaeota archaeon]|jgi:hypothetical protein|nr:hypothetical protein [Candidatus Woesearchaeota archaeon]